VDATPLEAPPFTQQQAVGAFVGEVDATAGTVSFTPLSSAAASSSEGASFAVYGDQNVLVRLFATNVTSVPVAGNPGLTEWSYNVGIQNLLPHAIGANQNAAAPSDTLGAFVFFISGPTVTAPVPCGGCSVQIFNQHGSASITTVARQPYFYWKERVAPAGSAGDQTVTQPRWIFRGSAAVTNFRFLVLVNAAWPPNAETRWKVDYRPDSTPNVGSEPVWKTLPFGNGGSGAITGGRLRITANAFSSLFYLRNDSIGLTQDAYVEGRMLPVTTSNTNPEALLGFAIPTKLIIAGFGRTRGGFIDQNGAFVAGTTFNWTFPAAGATIRLRKFGNQRAEVWWIRPTSTDTLLRSVNFTALPANPFSPLTHTVFGGSRLASATVGRWDWEYVVGEIGATQP